MWTILAVADRQKSHATFGRPLDSPHDADGAVDERRSVPPARDRRRCRPRPRRPGPPPASPSPRRRRRRRARRPGRAPRPARRSRRSRAAARKASTTSRWRARSASGAGVRRPAPGGGRGWRAAWPRSGSGPRSGAISSNGTANMSCSTNASRSAGVSVSSTTSSASPTESASSASCSGSLRRRRLATGRPRAPSSGSSRRDRARAQHVEAHPRATTVVSQPPEVLDVARVGAAEPQPGLLDGVVGLAQRAEHPVGHRPQVGAVLLELARPASRARPPSHSSSRSVMPLTIRTGST